MKLKNSVGRDEYISIDTSTILYHVASATNLPSILEQGILPADSTHRDNLETKLSHIAADHGIEFPVVRQDCVFC
jgi:RNA:NAD 2'-phosphotransferase (TPT1/KptA family)